jgi:aspartate carbamoyltransferase catalytic subunit
MAPALEGADVVMSLRMKHEYLKDHFVPNLEEYTRRFYISEKLLAQYAPNSVVLAPGPYIRGVEIDSGVIDGSRSLYAKQVSNGVAVRMAVLFLMVVARGEQGIDLELPDAKEEGQA